MPAFVLKELHLKNKPIFCSLLLILLFTLPCLAQKTGKQIQFKGANSLEVDHNIAKGAKRLIGNVSFEHERVMMFCDSAYLYSNNVLDAFGNVRIQQGDSISLYGDLLNYNGDTKKAEMRRNVRLVEKDMSLTTDFLLYDMATSVGSYTTGGTIVSKNNTLVSQHGYYHSKSKEFMFKKNVVLTNPEYVMNCDTLRYNTVSKIAYFLGPTTIKSNENLIYCENGWYDTQNDVSRFSKRSYIITREQKLRGDSIFYDRKKGFGQAVRNVSIIDTAQNMTIKGDYAENYELTETSVVTGNALLVQVYDSDTLFLHADTLRASMDTKLKLPQRILFAYHHVKFFKTDIQGKCDSLVYTYSDSTMRLFKGPVLWSQENQLTAEKVELVTSNGEMRSLLLHNTAFIISQEDTLRFNQIKGKTMRGSFKDNKLRRIFVEGNGQTVYYAKDKNKIIGVNKSDCSDILILLKDNEIEKITFITKPDATLYPLSGITPDELKLKDFTWKGSERPLSLKDIFRWE